MKVLQLGPYPPPYGGIQVNLVAIRRLLQERGHECYVINITRHRQQDGDGIYYPKSASELVRLLFRLRYDIVHLHIGGDLSRRLLVLAFLCCLVPGTKAVLTFHSGGYPSSPEGRRAGYNTLRGFVFRRFDRIITVNEQLVEMFERFGVSPSRIRLIEPHSVSLPPDHVALTDTLRSFFESHNPVLLTVGLLETHYDLSLQINVLEDIRKEWPSAGLAIVGSGSIEEELARQIAGKTYAEHVLLCGDVEHEVTLQAIRESDLFLRTTFYDGDSISVREAIHLGVPVIATANGMRPQGVHLVPVSDQAALVEAILFQLAIGPRHSPPSVRPEAGQDARDQNIAKVVEVYQQLIS